MTPPLPDEAECLAWVEIARASLATEIRYDSVKRLALGLEMWLSRRASSVPAFSDEDVAQEMVNDARPRQSIHLARSWLALARAAELRLAARATGGERHG